MISYKAEVEKYLTLPYKRLVYREDNEEGIHWVAEIEELGVAGDGDTPEEALHMLESYLPEFFEAALEDGAPIPEPKTTRSA